MSSVILQQQNALLAPTSNSPCYIMPIIKQVWSKVVAVCRFAAFFVVFAACRFFVRKTAKFRFRIFIFEKFAAFAVLPLFLPFLPLCRFALFFDLPFLPLCRFFLKKTATTLVWRQATGRDGGH
jgi:hypothetical protein